MADSPIESLAQKIEEPIRHLQAELVEIEYRRESGDQYLRIFIDRNRELISIYAAGSAGLLRILLTHLVLNTTTWRYHHPD